MTHPDIAAYHAAKRHEEEVGALLGAVTHAAWETAMEAEPDPDGIRPAVPSDVVPGAVVWYRHEPRPDEPRVRWSWSRVARVLDPAAGTYVDDDMGDANHDLRNRFVDLGLPVVPAMHPLVAAWIEAERVRDEVVERADGMLEDALEAARDSKPDVARLREATPDDVIEGAILWGRDEVGPPSPDDRWYWLRVDEVYRPGTGAFLAQGDNHRVERKHVETTGVP